MITQTPSALVGGPDCGKTPSLDHDMMAFPVQSSGGTYHRTNELDSKGRVIWRWVFRRERREK